MVDMLLINIKKNIFITNKLNKIMADIIQHRRDTKVNWETVNPILAEGEVGYVTDNTKHKLGDGISHWNDLPYRGFDGEVTQEVSDGEDSVPSNFAVKKLFEINKYNFFNIVDESFGNDEYDICQCIDEYQLISRYNTNIGEIFKILQLGTSILEGKEHKLFLNIINSTEVYNIDIVENEQTGIKTYNVSFKDVIVHIVFNWDKYNELFDQRYAPDNLHFGTSGLYIKVSKNFDFIIEGINNKIDIISNDDSVIKQEVSTLKGDLKILIKDKIYTPFPRTQLVEYFRNEYVLYNKPFESNGFLKTLNIGLYINHPIDTYELTLYIGKIDQRNLLINPRKVSYPLSELDYTIDYTENKESMSISLEDKNIKVFEGEVMCFFSRRYTDGSDGKSFLISRLSETSDDVLFATNILGTFEPCFAFSELSYTVAYLNADLPTKEEVKNNTENISLLSNKLNTVSIIKDVVTNEPYKLIIANGELTLKSLNYNKALFIGSSFVNHAMSESIGWFRNGAMAPSIDSHSLPNLVLSGLKKRNQSCTMSIKGSINWERYYNQDSYNFNTEFKSTLLDTNPDVIFMHISGNSTWTSEFKDACDLLIQNIKSTCPLADVFIAASWHGGQKATDFRNACADNNVTYVDLSSFKVNSNMWKAGDYYFENGNYYPLHEVVCEHPNDMGCLLQANSFLELCGYNKLDIIHKININTTGTGIVSTPNEYWVEDGIVTLRIESGTVNSILVKTSSDLNIPVVSRQNNQNNNYSNYYTFVMPKDDVIVNITFAN